VFQIGIQGTQRRVVANALDETGVAAESGQPAEQAARLEYLNLNRAWKQLRDSSNDRPGAERP
jgi:hypothetical protein